MKNELLHFSRHAVAKIRGKNQIADPTSKPDGFWVSVGPAWPEWCQAESFELDSFRFITRVELAPDANVLRMGDAGALLRFHHEFASDGRRNDWEHGHIHWDRVAEKYDGIIIAPYVWEHRLNGPVSRWYYTWDVASGCIWEPRCVASISCVELPDLSVFMAGAA